MAFGLVVVVVVVVRVDVGGRKRGDELGWLWLDMVLGWHGGKRRGLLGGSEGRLGRRGWRKDRAISAADRLLTY